MDFSLFDRRPQAAAIEGKIVERRHASRFGQRWENIHHRHDLIKALRGLKDARPAHQRNNTNTALEGLSLTAAKRCIVGTAIRISRATVVTEKEHNRVIGKTFLIKRIKDPSDRLIHGINHRRIHRPCTLLHH